MKVTIEHDDGRRVSMEMEIRQLRIGSGDTVIVSTTMRIPDWAKDALQSQLATLVPEYCRKVIIAEEALGISVGNA